MPDATLLARLVTIEFLAAALVFPLLLIIPAPYGRHQRAGWGPAISARAGWLIMESPAVVVPLVVFSRAAGGPGPGAWLLALWQLHYLQRTLVYPFLMRGSRSRIPLVTVGLAILFNLLNGTIIGWSLAVDPPRAGSPWLWVGVALFAAGFLINLHSDAILRSLRPAGASGYRIPASGAFRWVSAANYFGEIVEWTGFAVAAMTPAAWAFALFTAANLVPRARSHHRWYRQTFPDYPAARRAVLPYLF